LNQRDNLGGRNGARSTVARAHVGITAHSYSVGDHLATGRIIIGGRSVPGNIDIGEVHRTAQGNRATAIDGDSILALIRSLIVNQNATQIRIVSVALRSGKTNITAIDGNARIAEQYESDA